MFAASVAFHQAEAVHIEVVAGIVIIGENGTIYSLPLRVERRSIVMWSSSHIVACALHALLSHYYAEVAFCNLQAANQRHERLT